MPAALPGRNKGAALTKWSSSVSSTSGSRSLHETPGAAVTDTKSRPKKTPSTMPLSNKALASGEASAVSASAKSRVPASMTVWPGRNLRVEGFGVCSVRISMGAMWAAEAVRSRRRPVTEGRSAGNDPAGDADADRKADQRDPPFAGAHWLQPRADLTAAGDHRLGQPAAAQAVISNRREVQDDEAQNDVEPQLMHVACLVGGVDADQAAERAGVYSVLVFGDEPKPDLHGERKEHREHAQRAERIVADADPAPLEMISESARPAHEARPARRRAADKSPQQPKDQQRQDRAPRPDVPVGMVVVNRPPAERDQRRDEPVDQPDGQVPDRLLPALGRAQCFISARYLSWHALQVPPRVSSFALSVSTSPTIALL